MRGRFQFTAQKDSLRRFVASLRKDDSLDRYSAALESSLFFAGSLLVVCGLVWGVVRFLRSNPHMVVVLFGINCVFVALMTNHNGLMAYLPEYVQGILLNTTLFDLVDDNTRGLQNFCRRWGRVVLLTYARSAENVGAVLGDMDPGFVEVVFRKSLVQLLPSALRRRLVSKEAWVREVSKTRGADLLVARQRSHNHSERLDPATIATYTRIRDAEREKRCSELSLAPALFGIWFPRYTVHVRLVAGVVVAAVASLGVYSMRASGAKVMRNLLVQLLSITKSERGTSTLFLRRFPAVLGVLGGGAAVVALLCNIVQRRNGTPTKPMVTRLKRLEPECERSPEDSEASNVA